MAKAQGKKASTAGKKAAKKVASGVRKVSTAAKQKVAPKKAKPALAPRSKARPAPKKPAAKKPVAKKPVAKKPAVKKPAKPAAASVRSAAKAVKKAVGKVVAKAVAPAKKALAAKPPAAKAKAQPKAAPAPKGKPAPAKPAETKTAVAPKAKAAGKAAVAPAPAAPAPAAAPKAAEPEKKRGRRARPRILSNGAPAAAWLSTEKPRPASFIPAPARAEAPSAIAAPPASSDRLLRPDDVDHPAVRTVPVRIDVEQAAGRFYVIANPVEVTVRVGEGIEWDFRYLGGADVTVEEIVVEFEKPSPFPHTVFRTRKPGGARPHRQLSDGALPNAAGKRIQYTVRAMTPFRSELGSTKIWVNVNP